MKSGFYILSFGLVFTLLLMTLGACGSSAVLTVETAIQESAQTTATETAEETAEMDDVSVEFLTWYQYDETNEDPASDERVGNEYLRNSIPQFNQEFAGLWYWVNQPKAWDKMPRELVAAVIAGGTVPDIIEMGSQNLMIYYNNSALQDLSEWAKEQSWWEDMDPSGIAACTAPDGSLLCVPFVLRPHLTYV